MGQFCPIDGGVDTALRWSKRRSAREERARALREASRGFTSIKCIARCFGDDNKITLGIGRNTFIRMLGISKTHSTGNCIRDILVSPNGDL
jgi:hypothetical protein